MFCLAAVALIAILFRAAEMQVSITAIVVGDSPFLQSVLL